MILNVKKFLKSMIVNEKVLVKSMILNGNIFVKSMILYKKFFVLLDFEKKLLSCQILNQLFYNASDSKQ